MDNSYPNKPSCARDRRRKTAEDYNLEKEQRGYPATCLRREDSEQIIEERRCTHRLPCSFYANDDDLDYEYDEEQAKKAEIRRNYKGTNCKTCPQYKFNITYPDPQNVQADEFVDGIVPCGKYKGARVLDCNTCKPKKKCASTEMPPPSSPPPSPPPEPECPEEPECPCPETNDCCGCPSPELLNCTPAPCFDQCGSGCSNNLANFCPNSCNTNSSSFCQNSNPLNGGNGSCSCSFCQNAGTGAGPGSSPYCNCFFGQNNNVPLLQFPNKMQSWMMKEPLTEVGIQADLLLETPVSVPINAPILKNTRCFGTTVLEINSTEASNQTKIPKALNVSCQTNETLVDENPESNGILPINLQRCDVNNHHSSLTSLGNSGLLEYPPLTQAARRQFCEPLNLSRFPSKEDYKPTDEEGSFSGRFSFSDSKTRRKSSNSKKVSFKKEKKRKRSSGELSDEKMQLIREFSEKFGKSNNKSKYDDYEDDFNPTDEGNKSADSEKSGEYDEEEIKRDFPETGNFRKKVRKSVGENEMEEGKEPKSLNLKINKSVWNDEDFEEKPGSKSEEGEGEGEGEENEDFEEKTKSKIGKSLTNLESKSEIKGGDIEDENYEKYAESRVSTASTNNEDKKSKFKIKNTKSKGSKSKKNKTDKEDSSEASGSTKSSDSYEPED